MPRGFVLFGIFLYDHCNPCIICFRKLANFLRTVPYNKRPIAYLAVTLNIKALGNDDTLLRTHCCRHKCFPVCSRPQHLLRTQILCPRHKKMFLIQMFPSLRSPRNIMGNNVSATMCPRLPGPLASSRRSVSQGAARKTTREIFFPRCFSHRAGLN